MSDYYRLSKFFTSIYVLVATHLTLLVSFMLLFVLGVEITIFEFVSVNIYPFLYAVLQATPTIILGIILFQLFSQAQLAGVGYMVSGVLSVTQHVIIVFVPFDNLREIFGFVAFLSFMVFILILTGLVMIRRQLPQFVVAAIIVMVLNVVIGNLASTFFVNSFDGTASNYLFFSLAMQILQAGFFVVVVYILQQELKNLVR